MISNPTKSKPRLNARLRKAFSLIEVTISVGIIGTGVLLLLCLMPTGVNALRDASHLSMGRRISQNIISDLLLHEWSTLHTFDHKVAGIRYFDNQGIELRPAQSSEALFRVRVRVAPRDVVLDQTTPVPTLTSYLLPDDPSVFPAGTIGNLRRVHIDITTIPTPQFDTGVGYGPEIGVDGMDSRVDTYSAIISNMSDIDGLPVTP